MSYFQTMLDLNHLAVFVTAAAAMAIGMLWYSPALFGNMWMELVGMTKKDMAKEKANMPKTLAMGLLSNWVLAYIFASFIALSVSSAQEATVLAFWLWLGFQVTLQFGGVLWEKKPLNLFLINAAHQLVMLVVMSLILSSWV